MEQLDLPQLRRQFFNYGKCDYKVTIVVGMEYKQKRCAFKILNESNHGKIHSIKIKNWSYLSVHCDVQLNQQNIEWESYNMKTNASKIFYVSNWIKIAFNQKKTGVTLLLLMMVYWFGVSMNDSYEVWLWVQKSMK